MKEWIIVEGYYCYCINGERRAIIWFLGGHVERPDYWNVIIPFEPDVAFSTFIDAKKYVEEHFA